ncbi:hypothetical protein KDA08_05935 [Candidatus Saccharibacteria bacterium]|nr:hypothetical protein [Candidatus Saccharibacteria bacterium]
MKILTQPIRDFISKEIDKFKIGNHKLDYYFEDTLNTLFREGLPEKEIKCPIRGVRQTTIQKEFDEVYNYELKCLANRYQKPDNYTKEKSIEQEIREVMKKIDEYA